MFTNLSKYEERREKGMKNEGDEIVDSILVFPIAVVLYLAIWIYDSFLLFYIWNEAVIRAFDLQKLSLIQAIVINLLISWAVLNTGERKVTGKSILGYFVSSLFILLLAYLVRFFV